MQESKESLLPALVKPIGAEGSAIVEAFSPYFIMLEDWKKKASEIVVSDISEVSLMDQAREGRIFLKKKRVELEKTHKELKEESLRKGQVLDAIKREFVALVKPIEEHLEYQEKFAERKKAEERKLIAQKRLEQIIEFDSTITESIICDMTDDVFEAFAFGAKARYERKKREEEEAEKERERLKREAEEEKEKLRLENIRLKQEAEKRVLEEKQKLADLEEIARLDREEAEASLRKEKEEKARLESEEKARLEREKQAQIQKEEQEKAARLAPDKIKLSVLAERIDLMREQVPDMSTEEGKKIVSEVQILFQKIATHIRQRSEEL